MNINGTVVNVKFICTQIKKHNKFYKNINFQIVEINIFKCQGSMMTRITLPTHKIFAYSR